MTVGTKIRLARKHAEYTLPTAAKALGITVNRLQLYEHDDLTMPPALAVRAAQLFGISVEEICDDEGAFLKIPVYLDKGAVAPQKKDGGSFDIIANRAAFIPAGGSAVVDTGIHLALPKGYIAAVVSYPVLSRRYEVTAEGIIGHDEGESIKIFLSNHSTNGFFYPAGSKLARLLILPCQLAEFNAMIS